MKRRTTHIIEALAPALLLLFTCPAASHHSVAMFDFDIELIMSGRVTRFDYVNPHCRLHVDIENEDGSSTVWELELDAPEQLRYLGVSADFFAPDEPIKVKVNPVKDGRPAGFLAGATTGAGRSFRDTEGIED